MSEEVKLRNRQAAQVYRDRQNTMLENMLFERDRLRTENAKYITNLPILEETTENMRRDVLYVRTFVESLLRLTLANR